MIKTRKILAVFLASPSDLQAERQYARECVDEWNDVNADRSGWFVELMGWEDTLPQAGRPQEIINQEVDKCVLFVGMMHRLWGNPTGSGATSGFHEEFVRAADRFSKSGEPFISLFFKELGDVTDPGDQLSKVIEFRRDVTDSKRYFYKSLSNEALIWNADFRRNIHKLIFKLIDDLTVVGVSVSDSDSSDASAGRSPIQASELPSKAKLLALDHVSARIIAQSTDAEVSPVDVARLRLIATSWQAAGLAEAFLPTHDANLIYRLSDSSDISRPEVMGLIETGLSHFRSGNAPIWRWIQKEDSKLDFVRAMALFATEESARTGAFELLALVDDDFGELASVVEDHFTTFSSVGKNAALKYIAQTANQRLEQLALTEFRRGDYATQNSALLAVCAIKTALSPTEALKFLLDENVFPNGWDASPVLDVVDALTDDDLLRAIVHRESEIRSTAVRSLAKRDLISANLSSVLKSDPSASVRKEAVLSARLAGEQISISDASTIIVRKSANALLPGSKDGEVEFEEYREFAFKELPDSAIEAELESYYSPSEMAYKTLLERHWKSRADLARRDISDSFGRHLSELSDLYVSKYGESAAKSMVLPDKLKDFVVSRLVRYSLDVFASKGERGDIRLFRGAAKAAYFTLTKADLDFFSKFGEWGDIQLIASASRHTGGSLMIPRLSCSEREVADTILKIAKRRLGECLRLDLPFSIKSSLVRQMSKAAFKSLSQDDLLSFLSSENDDFRKWVAVRAAECLSRRDVVMLLDVYTEQSYIYYNVIHWLDLRVSAPSASATFISERFNATS